MLKSSLTYWMRCVTTLLLILRDESTYPSLYSIDQVLDSMSLSPRIREKCMRSLYKMCARHTLFPTSLRIMLCDDPTDVVLFRGGFGDVSKRIYKEREVAVKTLRTYSTSDLQTIIRVRFSGTSSYANHHLTDHRFSRGSARSLCRGRLFVIQMYYRSSE